MAANDVKLVVVYASKGHSEPQNEWDGMQPKPDLVQFRVLPAINNHQLVVHEKGGGVEHGRKPDLEDKALNLAGGLIPSGAIDAIDKPIGFRGGQYGPEHPRHTGGGVKNNHHGHELIVEVFASPLA